MSGEASELLIATDLDACLLDAETYSYEAARPALAALAAQRIPLILASSKTRAEIEPLVRALDLSFPFIVENGGALLVPSGGLARQPRHSALVGGFWTLVLGTRRERLLRALDRIARETGVKIRSFAALAAKEVQVLTGLTPAAAERAREREYDEPFLLDDEHAKVMAEAARLRSLRVTHGGRFWHLTGQTDKGRALLVLLGLYAAEGRRYSTVGLGDTRSDLGLLKVVDRSIVVPRPNGTVDPVLQAALPTAERAPAPGPAGWNAAVLAVLHGGRLPPVTNTTTSTPARPLD